MIQYNVYQSQGNNLTLVGTEEAASGDTAISKFVDINSDGLEYVAIPARYVKAKKVTVEQTPTVSLAAVADPAQEAPAAPAADATAPAADAAQVAA